MYNFNGNIFLVIPI